MVTYTTFVEIVGILSLIMQEGMSGELIVLLYYFPSGVFNFLAAFFSLSKSWRIITFLILIGYSICTTGAFLFFVRSKNVRIIYRSFVFSTCALSVVFGLIRLNFAGELLDDVASVILAIVAEWIILSIAILLDVLTIKYLNAPKDTEVDVLVFKKACIT